MKKKFYRALIQMFAAIMVLTAVPAVSMPVFAGATSFDISRGNIRIEAGTNTGTSKVIQTVSGTDETTDNLTGIPITGTTTQYAITVASSATNASITINNLNIDRTSSAGISALSLTSGAAVDLTLSGTSTLKSGENAAGIDVPQNSSLTVDGSGTLNVYGGTNSAGIGGNYDQIYGDISITNGIINAYGGGTSAFYSGAGIGGGGAAYGDSTKPDYSKISISGGTVNAYGGTGTADRNGAAGIGGLGYLTITISGGAVTATGGAGDKGGAGIGGSGGGGSHISISITGGTIDAAGGNSSGGDSGSGIGPGGTESAISSTSCTVGINKEATVAAYSYVLSTTGTTAVCPSSGFLESGSTGYVVMANFWNPFGSGNSAELRNSAGSAVNSGTTRVQYCNSVAFSVPSTGTYSLYGIKTGMFEQEGYWKHSTTTTGSTAYTIAAAGIAAFNEVTFYGGTLPVNGLSATSGSGNYTLSGSTATVDSGLTLSSFDSGIEKATVMVRNFKSGDVLEYPEEIGNITGSFSTGSGILTLTGTDTQANYQSALRSIGFYTISDDTEARIIDFSIGSGLYCSDTGHFYEYVPVSGNINWTNAKTAAEARSLFGRTGYLITITSEAESAFIKTKVTGTGWIGAKDIDSNTTIADWRWVTGPEGVSGGGIAFWYGTEPGSVQTGAAVGTMYCNWSSGEPNNSSKNENAGQMYADGTNSGQWNDLSETSNIAGYFVEYGGMAGDSATVLSASKTITIHSSSGGSDGESGGSGSGSGHTPEPSGAPVNVNGVDYSAGTAANSTENGKTVTTVTVDTAKLQKILDSQAGKPSVIIPVTSGAKVASGVLTGQMVDDMEGRSATLSLKTDSVTYTLPASEIDINDISKKLGENVALSDIAVDVRISEPSDHTASVVENAAEDGGFAVMIPAIDFNITCTYGGKTVEAEVFDVYVQRLVLVPNGVDPDKITTGVVVRPDGTSYHVPTEIKEIDGKYYVIINSLTNSTYTVVWHPVEFTDVANHWAKAAVNDMGSRMVINGVGGSLFEPGRNITRAEFAAIIVRALGLDTGMGEGTFSDVGDSDWYSGYIKTAAGYGIINGIGDGTFRPNSNITREQAMTMVARAMKITGLQPELSETETVALLSGYSDYEKISDYATDTVAVCLKTGVVLGRDNGIAPAEYITRAEVAVIAQRLLQKSDLI